MINQVRFSLSSTTMDFFSSYDTSSYAGTVFVEIDLMSSNESKIKALKQKYRDAHRAKLALVGPGPWQHRWRELTEDDITSLQGDDQVVGIGTSEGKRTLSWIWMGADGKSSDASGIQGLNDGA